MSRPWPRPDYLAIYLNTWNMRQGGQGGLNKSQTRALAKLKEASDRESQRLTAHAQRPPNSEMGYVSSDSSQINIRDLSAREIEDIADKAAKKERQTELSRARVSPSLSLEAKIVLMIPEEKAVWF